MAVHLPLLLAGAMLIASPGFDSDDPSDQVSDAQAFSAEAGTIIGAATACNQIDRQRLSAVAQKASDLVQSIPDQEEAASAATLLATTARSGRAAVEHGAADCTTVEASLRKLEQAVSE